MNIDAFRRKCLDDVVCGLVVAGLTERTQEQIMASVVRLVDGTILVLAKNTAHLRQRELRAVCDFTFEHCLYVALAELVPALIFSYSRGRDEALQAADRLQAAARSKQPSHPSGGCD